MKYKVLITLLATLIGNIPYRAFAAGFQDPLTTPAIQKIVQGFLNAIMYIGIPIIAVLIVIVGFRFVAAQGNEKSIGTSKAFAIKVLIGSALLIALGAIARMSGITVGIFSVGSAFVIIAFVFYIVFSKK